MFSLPGKRIFVAGETGLVGRGILRALAPIDCTILSAPHSSLDLTNQNATMEWMTRHRPDAVFMAAGRVGGIGANNEYPAEFIRDNLAMAQNVIEGARHAGVSKLLYLGSSCIYPKMATQPISEDSLMTGALEPTNAPYAIAKIAGLSMCQAYRKQYGCRFIAAMPTNLYGPHDKHGSGAHVIPAMMEKFHAAREAGAQSVTLWGTGTPLREFLHVDDLARALLLLMERYDEAAPINIGSGEEISIASLARMIAGVAGYDGPIEFDAAYPDGTPRKLLDSARMRALGWSPEITLARGLISTYRDYTEALGANLPKGRIYASSGT